MRRLSEAISSWWDDDKSRSIFLTTWGRQYNENNHSSHLTHNITLREKSSLWPFWSRMLPVFSGADVDRKCYQMGCITNSTLVFVLFLTLQKCKETLIMCSLFQLLINNQRMMMKMLIVTGLSQWWETRLFVHCVLL